MTTRDTTPGSLRVTATPASALPGDEPVVVDPSTEPATELNLTRGVVVGRVDRTAAGTGTVEVVVDGWRFELRVEPERRARLRERATRDRASGHVAGPLEVRAIIPGRVVSVAVATGDRVDAGQELLVVEAMKMQNELRSPRAGVVERVAVTASQTIELGDLLVVLAAAEAAG
ncbi:MAG: biotin/lipoyl-containing protein [Chloroflexota bacterium]